MLGRERHLQLVLELGRPDAGRHRGRASEPARRTGTDAGDAIQAEAAFTAGVERGGVRTPAAPRTSRA
jgi:hypothetical protein